MGEEDDGVPSAARYLHTSGKSKQLGCPRERHAGGAHTPHRRATPPILAEEAVGRTHMARLPCKVKHSMSAHGRTPPPPRAARSCCVRRRRAPRHA
eukprot:6329264-Prymnesium_polylepis.1